ncbi:hypothetical protein SAMN06265174_102431 [Dietzia kunjamensis subsp. schimae]|uniref:DUF2202 domain-containing protein n=1 Tax=Dietzia kunjamensis subsp. schimae TaxID=498198 RepID=A0ABY1MZK9_9ACTN|nr:DUF2202 domain-containing protein [Dietzia kunjamensis]SMO57747.1 hypothetical protein SAMN06265174_102431 [Dietzia kunjamensis subsp. schimae]
MNPNSNRTIRRSMSAVAAVGALAVAGVGGYALAGSDGPTEGTRVATVATQDQTGGPQGAGAPGQGRQGEGPGRQEHGQHGQHGQPGQQGQQGHGLEIPAPVGMLSAEEAETLSMMREEERLAHDLYVALGEAWPDRRFDTISAAEARHGEATATLLANHDLPDPSVGSTPGVYAYPELQELYDAWVERGLTSKSEALAVGAELERRDIADLEAAMEATEQPDLDAVYQHLRDGSEKHLAAFERG